MHQVDMREWYIDRCGRGICFLPPIGNAQDARYPGETHITIVFNPARQAYDGEIRYVQSMVDYACAHAPDELSCILHFKQYTNAWGADAEITPGLSVFADIRNRAIALLRHSKTKKWNNYETHVKPWPHISWDFSEVRGYESES